MYVMEIILYVMYKSMHNAIWLDLHCVFAVDMRKEHRMHSICAQSVEGIINHRSIQSLISHIETLLSVMSYS